MTVRLASQTKPRYGEGREALLRAAIVVVANSGLRNLTYRSVGRQAGVTHGLVAHHFGSRDALIEEALRYSLARSVDVSALIPSSGKIEDFAAGLADAVEADPELQAFQYELIIEARRRPELRPYVEQIYRSYRDATRRALLAVGIDDEQLANLVFVALDGLVFQHLALNDPEPTRLGLDRLRTLLQLTRQSS